MCSFTGPPAGVAYHSASSMLSPRGGFSKAARLPQVVLRLADIELGVQGSPDRGENLLVEFALSKLVDCINKEQWGIADDVIAAFPRSCCASSDSLFSRLVELRREFERTPGREVILEDLGLRRTLDTHGDDPIAGHSF